METDITALTCGPDRGVRVPVGELELDAHLDGPEDGEVLLLVSGLSRQRIDWPAALIRALHAAGLRTLTVDNRDVGRSSRCVDAPADGPPYVLADLAADHVGVLDHFGLDRVHALGVSMGGMIVQHLAIDHPQRLLSLTSVMSTTGDRAVGRATPEANAVLAEPEPTERAAFIEHTVEVTRRIGSPGHVDEEATRRRAAAAFDRGADPDGVIRQVRAIMGSPERTEALRRVAVPTLVLHGDRDPLIDPSGGEATAAAVPGARLHVLPGMAHDLPLAFLPEIVGAVVGHTRDAAARA